MVPRHKRRLTDEIYKAVSDRADELQIEPTELVCYIGYRLNYMKNKTVAEGFGDIHDGNFTNELSMEKACQIKLQLWLSKRGWTELRLCMKDFVRLPTSMEMSLYLRSLLPAFEYSQVGYWANVPEAVKVTLERLPKDVLNTLCSAIGEDEHIMAFFTAGFDGSGSHRIYNSVESFQAGVDTSHMTVAGISLIMLKKSGMEQPLLHRVEKATSPDNFRPVALCAGREEKLAKPINDLFNEALDSLRKNYIIIGVDGRKINVDVEIQLTILDGKARLVCLGLGGAYCVMCFASKETAHDQQKISEGFSIERDIESIKKDFERLKEPDSNGDFIVPRKRKDYSVRRGLTEKPLTEHDVCQDFSVLHSYIRFLAFILNLIYRFNADVLLWGPGKLQTDPQKDWLKNSEATIKENAKLNLGLKLDQPNQNIGGTSDTGNTAKRFFSFKSRSIVISLLKCSDAQKAATERFLQRASIILRIVSCGRKIDVESFAKYCQECYLDLIESFPWIEIPQTVHAVLAHAAERIKINDCYGLRDLSEQGLEGSNKIIRNAREKAARKTSLSNNLLDVMSFLWYRSDPIIRAEKRQLLCSRCYSRDHTARGCPEIKVIEIEDDDDVIFDSFLLD